MNNIADYLEARRYTIEASIAAEMLAGNEWKLACERTALAEIAGLEAFLLTSSEKGVESHQIERGAHQC